MWDTLPGYLNMSLGVSFNRVDYQMRRSTKAQMVKDGRQYQPAMPVIT